MHPVPPELLPLIVSALDDPVTRVQMAAAVCHYAMGTPDARAREILRSALHKGKTSELVIATDCTRPRGFTHLQVKWLVDINLKWMDVTTGKTQWH